MAPLNLHGISRIDQARGVLTLTVHAFLSDTGPGNVDVACVLDLASEELQRLRDAEQAQEAS